MAKPPEYPQYRLRIIRDRPLARPNGSRERLDRPMVLAETMSNGRKSACVTEFTPSLIADLMGDEGDPEALRPFLDPLVRPRFAALVGQEPRS
jgi:hypothetical protein